MFFRVPHILQFFLLQLILVKHGLGQSLDQHDEENEVESNKLEDVVVNDMLRIVDHKFDTLTTRITALERAVSGLQFFSIRQFRQLSAHIQKTQTGVITVGKKVNQLETDGRGLKIAMSLLNRDVSNLKSTTTDMLAELESSVVYINDNVDKQVQDLRDTLAEESKRVVAATDELLVSHGEKQASLYEQVDKKNQTVKCSADFNDLHDHLDVRLSDFKQELVSQCLDPIAGIQSQVTKLENNGPRHKLTPMNNITVKATVHPEMRPIKNQNEIEKERDTDPEKQFTDQNDDIDYYNESDEKIMKLLINMTTSVLQAVRYFRQNGGLLEETLVNTHDLIKGQNRIYGTMTHFLVGSAYEQRNKLGTSNDIPDFEEDTFANFEQFSKPEPITESTSDYENVIPVKTKDSANCELPGDLLKELSTISKNGSQLLEILTDLAQMSSMSLIKATGSLQEEVKQLEEVRMRMMEILTSHTKPKPDSSLEFLKNSTKRIYKIVESNTGWLRLIFRNNQQVEKLVNRSLSTNFRINEDSRLKETNEIIRSKKDDRVDITDSVTRSKDDVMLDKISLETIYSTSLQLNRIMPALTKLLAEPDPLITLVDGGDPDRGRLEIYNNGQWGTVCHKDLTNEEADGVCRHLGFSGGFSAGAGHFGPGTGAAWTLNVTCLGSHTSCSSVKLLKDMSLCDHDKDVAIVCDHVLRIATNESTSNKIGRLEIMHQGLWLPICGEGWSGFSARVACKQMGFVDGRELEQETWLNGANTTWLNKVACNGDEPYLDACQSDGWSWTDSCLNSKPAGVRCL